MRKLNLYDIYDDVVLSYKTDHKFHGAKRIEIEGTVILNKIVVEYPAKINGEFGILAFDQPIDAPLYQNYIPQPFPLFVGGTEQFDHLMFNGPDYFKIRVDEYKPWMYIGNIYDSELDITPVYKYYRQENDLHKLETIWKRNSSY
tara:strand:+ start:597 stop:1031 length:435 start_codon:yes stop_codon:yes gene_type:complete